MKEIKVGDVFKSKIHGEYTVIKQIDDHDYIEHNITNKGWLLENGGRQYGSYESIILGNVFGRKGDKWLWNGIDYSLQDLNKTNYMNTFKNTIKNLMRTEPEKTFVEVGFLDIEENITTKGREALEYILWEKHKDELKKLADQIVSKESKKVTT